MMLFFALSANFINKLHILVILDETCKDYSIRDSLSIWNLSYSDNSSSNKDMEYSCLRSLISSISTPDPEFSVSEVKNGIKFSIS